MIIKALLLRYKVYFTTGLLLFIYHNTLSNEFIYDKKFLKSCQQADFIFSGERHDVITKFETQLALLQFLYTHAGVQVFCLEYPYSYGILIHQYFKTGNEKILDSALTFFNPKEKENTKYYSYVKQMFIELNKFNNSLPENKKIVIEFIDCEPTNLLKTNPAIIQFYQLLNKEICDSIIDANKWDSAKAVKEILGLLKQDDIIKVLNQYPEKYHHVNKIIKNFQYLYEKDLIKAREKHLFNALVELKKTYAGKKIFIQIGYMHIAKNRGDYAVLTMLNKEKYKTISLYLYYKKLLNENGIIKNQFSIFYDRATIDKQILNTKNNEIISTKNIKEVKDRFDYLLVIDSALTANFLR
jgi:hypothetical protein